MKLNWVMRMFDLVRCCWQSISNRRRFIGYLVARLIQALLSVVAPLVAGVTINMLLEPNTPMGSLILACLFLAICCILAALFDYLATLVYTYLQADSSFDLELHAIQHIQHLRPAFFKGFDPAYWRRRLDDDTNGLSLFFLMSIVDVLKNTAILVVIVVVLFVIDPLLSLVSIVLAIASGGIYMIFMNRMYKTRLDFTNEMSQYSSRAQEQLEEAEFIRKHVLFNRSTKRLKEIFFTVREAMYQTNKVAAQVFLCTGVVQGIAQAALLFVAAREVFAGHMQVGYVATAFGYFTTMVTSVEYFEQFGRDYQSARVNYNRLQELWDEEEEPNGSGVPTDTSLITCDDVAFSYPGNKNRTLRGVSGRFQAGKIYALAGTNGCGKSTLLKLLSGEYFSLYDGSIYYGNTDLATLDQYALRHDVIGIVEQEPAILQDTLWNNLTLLCNKMPSEDRVLQLVNLFGLQKFLSPDRGLQSVIDAHRVALSGGEKQKIAIIRMLLKDPEVMLLDEPTSALDAASRSHLIDLLKDFRKDHLVIVVSHDEELLAVCDEVREL